MAENAPTENMDESSIVNQVNERPVWEQNVQNVGLPSSMLAELTAAQEEALLDFFRGEMDTQGKDSSDGFDANCVPKKADVPETPAINAPSDVAPRVDEADVSATKDDVSSNEAIGNFIDQLTNLTQEVQGVPDGQANDASFNTNAPNEDSRPLTAKLMNIIDILNASIGNQEATDKHQLNLNMLYALLLALIDKLDMKDSAVPVDGISLPSTNALLKGVGKETAAVTEMWNIIQLQKQTEANRDGINKLMEITNDILEQLNRFKDDTVGMSERLDKLSGEATSAQDLALAAKNDSAAAMARVSQAKAVQRGDDDEDDESRRQGGKRRDGKTAGVQAGESSAADLYGDKTALERLEELEAQVKRLQKFRKAATFKIQDLPDDVGRVIKVTSDVLGFPPCHSGSTPSGHGHGGVGEAMRDSIGKVIKTLRALPELSFSEMRGLAELLERALAGTEWDRLKSLIAEINIERGTVIADEDLLSRLEVVEEMLGVGFGDEAGIAQSTVTVESTASSAVRSNERTKGRKYRELRELRKDVNNLGEVVKSILEGGGAEAAQRTFEEMRSIWQRVEKHGSDIERAFAHIDGIETKVKDLLMQLNGVSRLAQTLKDDKADKKWVRAEIDEKADRAELHLKLDQGRYNKDMEEIDAVISELEGQISEAMVKFYRELHALKVGHNSKLNKDSFAELSNMLMQKSAHMDQLLTFVSEVFNGDKDADLLKNEIIRNNCVCCDRTVYRASQPVEPSIPRADGMNAARSIAPATSLRRNELKKGFNNSSINGIRGDAIQCSANSQFLSAVAQRESLWRERSERTRLRRHEPPEVVGRVRVRDLRDFNNDAYYRATGPGEYLDTYAQDPRPAGGDFSQVRKDQRILQSPNCLPPLSVNANNITSPQTSLAFHGVGDTAVAVPKCLLQGPQEVDLVCKSDPHQTYTGRDVRGASDVTSDTKETTVMNPPSSPS